MDRRCRFRGIGEVRESVVVGRTISNNSERPDLDLVNMRMLGPGKPASMFLALLRPGELAVRAST